MSIDSPFEQAIQLGEEDAVRLLTDDAGWLDPEEGERSLLAEQLKELLALIRPPLAFPNGEARLKLHLDRIFRATVERYVLFSGTSPRKELRTKLEQARTLLAGPTPDEELVLPPDIGQVMDFVVEERLPTDAAAFGKPSLLFAGLTTAVVRAVRVEVLNDVAAVVQRGPDAVIIRLMVRALAALVTDRTGEVPRRNHRVSKKDKVANGEQYWFLDLARRLAEFVKAAVPQHTTQLAPAFLTGVVKGELKRLRDEKDGPD